MRKKIAKTVNTATTTRNKTGSRREGQLRKGGGSIGS
jgi:hypothetical protein